MSLFNKQKPCHADSPWKCAHYFHPYAWGCNAIRKLTQTIHSLRDAEATFQLASKYHQSQHIKEATVLLEQLIQQEPKHHKALNLLGSLVAESGEYERAEALFSKAKNIDTRNPVYHCNLAKAVYLQKKTEMAIAHLHQSIELKPDWAQSHYDLASLLNETGQIAPAIDHYQQALKLNPEYIEALRSLGTLMQNQGRHENAMTYYQKALSLSPKDAKTHLYIAEALSENGETESAIQSYFKAISYKKDFAVAYNKLAQLLYEHDDITEAITIYETWIRLNPDDWSFHAHLGWFYNDMGRYSEAVSLLQDAINKNQNSINIYNNLGCALTSQGHIQEALDAFHQALSIQPDSASVYSNLLFTSQYSSISSKDLFELHLKYSEQIEHPIKPTWLPHENTRNKERPLRVGYVSGDLWKHTVSYFFEPILKHHNKEEIETYCYNNSSIKDENTHLFMNMAAHWINCAKMSDDELAARIREDGIDILVDLSGHTARNRLPVFARKPAPVQVTWIGYAGTTGLASMDYRLTDAYMDPPGQTERYHTENLVRLPHSAPYQPPADCPDINELPALTHPHLTLASLNEPKKINQRVAHLWGRILTALPGSRLMLGNVSDDDIRRRLIELFEQAGVSEERLILQPRVSMPDYLALHHQIDLGLDPFPYNGGTTSMHALWMGVPVISLAGEHPVSRCGAAIMSRVGLENFITCTEEEYLQRVLEIARDLPSLSAIRHSLRARMLDTTNDDRIIVQELEAAYRQMWQRWCDQRIHAPAANEAGGLPVTWGKLRADRPRDGNAG